MRRGQALVVVVVILAVVLTVGLSIAMRGVTEVNISTGQKEAAIALEAAEAGAEQAVGGQLSVGNSSGSTQNASYDVVNASLAGNSLVYPYKLERGDVATLNLTGFTGSGLCFYFGDSPTTDAALEFILYSRNGATYVTSRQAVDAGSHGNGFSGLTFSANCALSWPGRSTWTNLTNMGMPSGYTPLTLRIRMLYQSTPQPLAVSIPTSSAAVLPIQGNEIYSTGRSGESVQKVRVVSLNPDLPMMFDSAVFSGGGISQ